MIFRRIRKIGFAVKREKIECGKKFSQSDRSVEYKMSTNRSNIPEHGQAHWVSVHIYIR